VKVHAVDAARHGRSLLRFFGCILACVTAFLTAATLLAATMKAPEQAPAVKPEPKPPAEDPLGRSTPYGTVIGFLRAADRNDYERAASYLDGKQPAQTKQALARDLKSVLNRSLKIGIDDLSKVPEGHLDDGLDVYVEKIGTATYGTDSLDIVLRRTTKADSPPLWLFSPETLLRVADAADQLELGWGEAIWSDAFRDITVFSYPLFMLINQLVIIPLSLVAAWLLSRCSLALLRPLLVRGSAPYGESGLAQMKWVLFLLSFAVIVRVVAPKVVTVSGRIVFAVVASVLLIVAVTWLLVHITRFVTHARILRLHQAGIPSSIAVVELSGWIISAVFVIVGLLAILRALGFEITTAMAGLGVGGIAIAFAAQKTIENLFGTVTIVTDKPIHVGDQCQAGSIEGGVESIGLRSTRIRTADRGLVTIPNGQLAGMTIGNLTHRDKFLFRHNIRLRCDTTATQLGRILANVTSALSTHPKLEADTVRTRLIRFGDYSIDVEVFAYVLTRDGLAFLQIQQDLLLEIMDIIEASGTSVALPFQSDSGARDKKAEAAALDVLAQTKHVKSA
jgi:MscS family membrane protein